MKITVFFKLAAISYPLSQSKSERLVCNSDNFVDTQRARQEAQNKTKISC